MPTKVLNDRKTRTTSAIIKYLKEEVVASTPNILDFLNDYSRSGLRYGCTSNRLNNLLGKKVEFEECGEEYLPAPCYYHVKIWGLAAWV